MVAGVHVKGNLTLAEDLADTGGLRLAWSALTRANGGPVDKKTSQLFFESFAQVTHLPVTGIPFYFAFMVARVFLLTLTPGVVLQDEREVAAPQRAHGPARPFTSACQRWTFQHA